MNWGGIIAGAMRGGAEAVGEIADRNLKAREEEALFQRNQAAQRQQVEYASKLDVAKFHAIADRKLADAPKEAAAKIDEERKARLGQVAEVDSAHQGLTKEAIAKKANAVRGKGSNLSYDDLSQEEVARLGLTDAESGKLRTQAARNVGLISEKDVMASEQRGDLAQLRADVQNAKTQAQLQIAQERLQNALTMAAMRGAGNGAPEKDRRNEILQNERKAVEASNTAIQRRIREMNEEAKEASWLVKDSARMTPEQKERASDWRNEKARLQARLTMNESQMDEISTSIRDLFSAQNERRGGASRESSSPRLSNGRERAAGETGSARSSTAPIIALPPGAKQIGTSGGRPVFQTPDGRRFIGQSAGIGGGE